MLKEGILPWESDGVAVAPSLMVAHGRKFHTALSEIDRTAEEVKLLKVDRGRLLAWFPFVEGQVQIAISAAQEAVPAATGGQASASAEQASGSEGQASG